MVIGQLLCAGRPFVKYLLRKAGLIMLAACVLELSAGTAISQSPTNANGSAPQLATNQNPERFTEDVFGLQKAVDGKTMRFTTFKGSNGTFLSITRATFSSPKVARAEVQAELKSAKEIIQHYPKRTSTGRVIGDRAVVSYTEHNKQYIAVAWTEGRKYYSLETSSPLQRALQLEERFNAGVDLDDPAAKSN